MTKRTNLNQITRERLTFRELARPSHEQTGFVLRVVTSSWPKPRIVTIAQQPGHETVTSEVAQLDSIVVSPNGWDSKEVYGLAPAEPKPHETVEGMPTFLRGLSGDHPLVAVALQHLEAVVPKD